MLTEADVQAAKPGQIMHGDERCEAYRVTSVRPTRQHPDHYELWAISPSGGILVRITCNSQPGFHRASDHEPIPKARPKLKIKRPPVKRKVKRARRAA